MMGGMLGSVELPLDGGGVAVASLDAALTWAAPEHPDVALILSVACPADPDSQSPSSGDPAVALLRRAASLFGGRVVEGGANGVAGRIY